MYPIRLLTFTSMLALAASAHAATPASAFSISVDGISTNKLIPERNARCKPTPDGKSTQGENLQPAISWANAPNHTQSFAVFVIDPDVPADFADAGKEGKTIAENAPRKDFFHYGAVNIPANTTTLSGVAGAKNEGTALVNDMGLNKYVPTATSFGGPCPPWNDARLHHYHFIVMALDAYAPLQEPSAVDSADTATQPNSAANTYKRLISSGHVLAKSEVVGTYTLNKTLRK